MAQQIVIESMPDVSLAYNSGGGTGLTELNVGVAVTPDGDGVSRAHKLSTSSGRMDNGMTQAALAANTLSNSVNVNTNQPFTLLLKCSAAGTVSFYVVSQNSGSNYFQVCKADGTPFTVTFTAGQYLAIPMPVAAFNLKVQSTVQTDIFLYVLSVYSNA